VTEQELAQARASLRSSGEVGEPLLEELRAVVERLGRFGGLPASMSPFGSWDQEATEELLQGWLEGKLLRGDLLALLDRARAVSGLRRMAEQSLRHWLLNQRERSQSQNLYSRIAGLLCDSDSYVVREDSARPQDVWWTLAAAPDAPVYAGDARMLSAVAWSLGELEVVRYSSEASKNSPLLSRTDLERFVRGMLEVTESALTLTLLMRALQARFDLAPVHLEQLEENAGAVASEDEVAEEVVLRDAAWAVISELSSRQADILLGKRADESLEVLAERHGCSRATVHNELARIGAVATRYSENPREAGQILNIAGDLLYEHSGDA
jgi:hypothetical protein